MEQMTIELRNEKAAGLLHVLEELQLIRIVSGKTPEALKQKRSEKYWGILTKEQGEDLDRHIDEVRNEWEQDT